MTAGGAIPNIFGMAEAKFTTLVKAYRDKQLPNPVMQSVAAVSRTTRSTRSHTISQ